MARYPCRAGSRLSRQRQVNAWKPYCGTAPSPGAWATTWNFDPVLLTGLIVSLAVAHIAADRKAFAAGWMVIAILFVSPVCALTSALFSVRVTHHVLLAGAAAPLLARAFALRSAHIVAATAASIATLYAWHVPAVYEAALASTAIYWLLTLALLAGATWFWVAVRSVGAPAAIAALLVTMVAMGLLGALLTFTGSPLYAPHYVTTRAWGLSPLEDQQLAGLVMWAPAAGLYLAAALHVGCRILSPDHEAAAA